jgi:chorismate mutase
VTSFIRLPVFALSLALFGMGAPVAAQASDASQAPKSLMPLLKVLNERLNIADSVALTKWDSGKPVQDSPREVQVIDNAKKQATEKGLNPDDIGQLLAAQIEANKLVQYGLLSDWQAKGKAPNVARPDLAKQIRPQLDDLQNRLLQEYAEFAPYRNDANCANWLTHSRAHLAKDPLHQLALIRATGELCNAGTPHAS